MEFKTWLEAHKHTSLKTWLLSKFDKPIFALASQLNLAQLKNWAVGEMMNMGRSVYRHLPNREDLPPNIQHGRDVWESWRFHNFQPSETFEPGRVETGKSLDEFIANSQFYQEHIVQYATESYRRVKFSQVSGIFQFDFSDPWPAITWSVVDYWRRQKPAFTGLRNAMQPVLPTLGLPLYVDAGKTVITSLMVVNDLPEAFPGTQITWETAYGDAKITSGEWTVDVPANDVSTSKLVGLPFTKAGDYSVSIHIHAADGKLLGENSYRVKAA
jgi:beta-mannosidase